MDLEKTQLVSQLSHSFLSSVLENLSQKTDFLEYQRHQSQQLTIIFQAKA